MALALNPIDGAELRLGRMRSRGQRVQKAEFGHKQHGASGHGGGGERKVVDRKKATKRIGKMQRCVSSIVSS